MTLTSESTRLDAPVVAASSLDRVIELLGVAERATAEAGLLIGGLTGTGLAEWLGYVSLERAIAHRTGCGNRTASGLLRVARFLDRFPRSAEALRSGRIVWAEAEVLARTGHGLPDAYAMDEGELLVLAESVEVEALERACRLWRARADTDAAATDAEHRFRQRGLWLQFAFDGSCRGRLQLDADAAETVTAALDGAPDPVAALSEPRSLAQRRADNLVDLCHGDAPGPEHGSGSGSGPEHGECSQRERSRSAVDVVIDIHTLAGRDGPIDLIRSELDHGGPIMGPGLDRLLCDASFRAIVTDGPRQVLAYNRATPAIPGALRRAVRVRDRTCVFHGCDRHWQWCDLHHLVPRHRGGPTIEENLAVVCRFHHRLIHEGGWQLSRAPDGTITTTSP